jgi:hypothetical protein
LARQKPSVLNRAAIFSIISLGTILAVASVFYASSFLVILGVSLFFWGIILTYITPSKHVPLTLLNATVFSASSNIEKILLEKGFTEKGKYLPPKLMKDFESSSVFIPEQPGQLPPQLKEVTGESPSQTRNVLLITPPGLGLSKLFEKLLGISFTKTDLSFVQQKLPTLLVEDLKLAKTVNLQIKNDTIVLELTGNVFKEICQDASNFPRAHKQVGCIFSSAVACVLAKASGKMVTIQKDELSFDGTTTSEYQIMGE